MYLTTGDLFAVMLVLSLSIAMIVTSAVANARLTRKVAELRSRTWELCKSYEQTISEMKAK